MENHGTHLLADVAVLRVAHQSQHRVEPARIRAPIAKTFADRVFVTEKPAREGLVDQRVLRRVLAILPAELAPRQNGNAGGRKEARTHVIIGHARLLRGPARTFDPNRLVPPAVAEYGVSRQRHRPNACQSRHALGQTRPELPPDLGRLPGWTDLDEHQVLTRQTKVHGAEVLQALSKQPGSD